LGPTALRLVKATASKGASWEFLRPFWLFVPASPY
jgi:hypothetical protein